MSSKVQIKKDNTINPHLSNSRKWAEVNVVSEIIKFFDIKPFEHDIIQWAKKNINYTNDVSAQRNTVDFDTFFYQVDPLKEWESIDSRKVVTVVACEQMGKSNIWIIGLLYRMIFNPGQSLVVYPSADKCIECNQTKLKPLMSHIPGLKEELSKPLACRSDRYRFSNLVSYFQGAGSKVASKSCQIVVGDEVDLYPPDNRQIMSDLEKRTRSYNSSMLYLVCTPSTINGNIWQSFLKGSQGFFYLRCKECNELTIRSCDISNLNFDKVENEALRTYTVIPGTERLICPKCGHAHVEADKKWMITNGGYIHKIPELKSTRPSYQIGALASQLPSMTWRDIANAQLEAGKTSSREIIESFDNSWRGLPVTLRKISINEIESIRDNHLCNTLPSQSAVEMIYVVADTMDTFISYAVIVWDVYDNLYVIHLGRTNNFFKQEGPNSLESILTQPYLIENNIGITPTFLVIDEGGHRADEVKYFAKRLRNVIMWKGFNLGATNFKISENMNNLIIGNERFFKAEAIYYLYTQKNKSGNYLYLSPSIENRFIEEIADVRPDKHSKFGDLPKNWISQTGNDHSFDLLKYAYFARMFSLQTFKYSRFRLGKSPFITKKFEKLINQRNIPNKKAENNWFNLS